VTSLRAIAAPDVELIERQYVGPEAAGEHSWFGYRAPGRLAELVAARETLRTDGGRLAVIDGDGQVVGEVSWNISINGPPPNGECWNLGIWIAPEARGLGHGSAAQRLAAAYLFEHTMCERVEAGTESTNVAEQRALEKAGFTKEGVLRRSCFRGGEWRDMVVYSKLRGEA
jgi:RimJ/RimL family protein N-acetyltransferase